MRIKTYIINLERSVERREHVLSETAKYSCMDVELVTAVSGKDLLEEDVEKQFDKTRFRYRYNYRPSLAEIGCTLSHRECYRRLLESAEEVALVLEDDVCFVKPDHLEAVLSACKFVFEKKKKAGLITLSEHRVGYTKGEQLSMGYLLHKVWLAFGTNAYLINREAARRLLAEPKASIVADDYSYIRRKGICVFGIVPNVSFGLTSNGLLETEIQPKDRTWVPLSERSFMYSFFNYLSGKYRALLLKMGILTIRNYTY